MLVIVLVCSCVLVIVLVWSCVLLCALVCGIRGYQESISDTHVAAFATPLPSDPNSLHECPVDPCTASYPVVLQTTTFVHLHRNWWTFGQSG